MKIADIKLGEFYRVRGNNYAYAQVIAILPPKTGINDTRAFIAECRWVVNKNDKVGMIMYFKISDLVKCEGSGQ